MAQEQDLPAIQRGDTIPYFFTWDDGTAVIDMRGKTVVMTVKLSIYIEDEEATVVKTVEVPADDSDAQQGNVFLQLESSDTSKLIAGQKYHYAVRVIEPGSPEAIETTQFYGRLPVEDA